MSALGKTGRPTRAEQGPSDELSDRLLAEYSSSDISYKDLGAKHGMAATATWYRCQRARERLRECKK